MKLEALAKLLQQDPRQEPQEPPKKGKIVPLRRSQTENERKALEAYKAYTSNRVRSGHLQAEIMQGLQAGEPIASLFLKAMDAIGAMTGTEQPKIQATGYLESVYGIALKEPEAAQITAQSVTERLAKLEQAQTLEPNDRNIQAAKKKHRAILEHLQ